MKLELHAEQKAVASAPARWLLVIPAVLLKMTVSALNTSAKFGFLKSYRC